MTPLIFGLGLSAYLIVGSIVALIVGQPRDAGGRYVNTLLWPLALLVYWLGGSLT